MRWAVRSPSWAKAPRLVVDTCQFVYNEAVGARGADGGAGLENGMGGQGRGGGIYADPGTTVRVNASLFGGNRVRWEAGAATMGPASSTARGVEAKGKHRCRRRRDHAGGQGKPVLRDPVPRGRRGQGAGLANGIGGQGSGGAIHAYGVR